MDGALLDILKIVLEVKYLGIAAFMFLENTVLPIPSETILIIAGYFIYLGQLNYWGVVLAASLGAMIGSLALYEFSRRYGEKFIEHYGKYILMKKDHIKRAEKWFDRYGNSAVFFGNFVPVIRHAISIPAGTSKMNRIMFCAYTFAAAFLWNMLVVYICALLGGQWEKVFKYMGALSNIMIFIAAAIIVIIVLIVKSRR